MPTLNLGRVGFVNKGTWVDGLHKNNDVVKYTNRVYVCILDHTSTAGDIAVTDTAYWDLWLDGEEFYTKTDVASSFGRLSSPLLDLPLKNSLSMKAGVGAVTFTRNTTGTYIDRYGVLKTAGIDEPRFEKDGLLVEGTSTNVCLSSATPDTAYASWYFGRAEVDLLSTVIAPDGVANAVKVKNTSTLGSHYFRVMGDMSPDSNFSGSVFIKAAEVEVVNVFSYTNGVGAGPTISFNLITGQVENGSDSTFKAEKLNDGWFRLSTASVVGSGSGDFFHVGFITDETVGDGLYVYGGQIEQLQFASSYIPTTTAAVTRGADDCSVDSINNIPKTDTVNTNMTIATDFNSFGHSVISQIIASQYYSPSNHWYMRQYPTDSRVGTVSISNDVSTSRTTVGNSEDDSTATRKFILTLADKVHKIYLDAELFDTYTRNSDNFTDNLLGSKIHLGSFRGTSYHLFGHMKNLKIYDVVLTPQEVALL